MKTRFTFSAILTLTVFTAMGSGAWAQTPTPNAAIPPVQVTVTNSNTQAVPVKVTNPTPPPSTVTINNSAAQPVPTTDPTNAAVSPTLVAFVTASLGTSDTVEVPFSQNTGRRFMVRYLSAFCGSETPGNYVLKVNGPNLLFMPIETKLKGSNFEQAVGGTPVEMMIDSGKEVTFQVSRAFSNTAKAANCEIGMVGYTVPQPPVQQ